MKIARIVMPFTALTIMAAPCYATDTLTSFEALKAALSEMDANVVLDMSTITSEVSANIDIAASQSVVLKNITSWTNPAAAIDTVTPRMIINNGTLALDNVGILNNTLFVSSAEVGGGASILNKGKILEISNSRFNDNFVGSIPKNDLWGGLISNLGAGEIATIKDTVFTGNRFETAQSAPHGAVIYNASKIGRIENVDFIDNVMTAQANFKGGGHGTAIDNNQYSEIGVITNTRFIDNKTYKPGTNAPEGHASGGALDNYNIIGEISNSLFQGNVAETESKNAPAMGGSIKNSFATNNGAIGLINLIKNVDFIENRAVNSNGAAYGGAYSTSYTASNAATTVKSMQDVMFRGNYASGNLDTDNMVAGLGGAIYSYGVIGELSGDFIDNYAENKHGKSWAQGGAIHNSSAVANINNMTATFNGNYANAKQGTAQGGAIWNMGTISMTDSTFLNNGVIGSQDTLTGGGAIWNSGTITMRGQNNFMNNKTQIGTSVYDNDIFNSGTINVTQDATLNINGGMTGNDGTINIAQNATLNINGANVSGNNINMSDGATLAMYIDAQSDSISVDGNIALQGTNNLNVGVLFDGTISGQLTHTIANSVDLSDGDWNIVQSNNSIYDVMMDITNAGNVLNISYNRKSISEVADALNTTETGAAILMAMLPQSENNEDFNSVAKDINRMAQLGDNTIGAIMRDIGDLSATTTTMLIQHADTLFNTLQLLLMDNSSANGRSGGDIYNVQPDLWVRGLYQTFKHNNKISFDADGFGVMIGADSRISKNLTVGLGYSFSKTNMHANVTDSQVDSNNFFAYGKYNHDNWIYNAMAMYEMSDFQQNQNLLNRALNSSYDTDMFGLQLSIGHMFTDVAPKRNIAIIPNAGVRVYHIIQNDYTDTLKIKHDKTNGDIMTLVAGFGLTDVVKVHNTSINQNLYINATYNALVDGGKTLIQLPNANQLYIDNDLDRELGIEFGYGISVEVIDRLQIGVNYDFNWHADYTSHAGTLSMRYVF